MIRNTRFVISVSRGHGSKAASFALRFGSTQYWVGSTRSISLEVRLEGMVDNNLLVLESGASVAPNPLFRVDVELCRFFEIVMKTYHWYSRL